MNTSAKKDTDAEFDRESVIEEIQRFRQMLELCTDLLSGCTYPESLERPKDETGYYRP